MSRETTDKLVTSLRLDFPMCEMQIEYYGNRERQYVRSAQNSAWLLVNAQLIEVVSTL